MTNFKERIDHIESEKEWLDNRVSSIFSKYCQTFGINEAHGVSEWEIWGDKIEILQNVSCRGCYDVERRKLPIEYLYGDYDSLIERDFQDQQNREEEKKRIEKEEKERKRSLKAQQREEKDKTEYERLKAKFEGENDE